MTKDSLVRLRKIYKILLSASIIIAGGFLIYGCLSIYFSANGFTRNIVVKTFSKINIPVLICLSFVIGDIVWELISPSETKNKKINKKTENIPFTPTTKSSKNIKFIILIIALSLLIIGAVMGGFKGVFSKAANICDTCIGLG